jgi:DNA-binding SARP family transcriptional activator
MTGLIRWLGTLAVVSAAVAATARPAAAITDEMEPYEADVFEHVVPAEDTFYEPEDGRLRGYGFAADVEFVTEAVAVEDLMSTEKAPAGFKIMVAGVKLDVVRDRDDEYPIRGTFIVDGKRLAVDYPFAVSRGQSIGAAVPVDAKSVEFEMESAGTAQRFSLTERRRVGFQPMVLYRDPAWPDVTTDVNADRIIKISDDEAEAQATLLVNSVRLSWFSPRNPIDIAMAERNPEERSSPIDPVTSPKSSRKAFLIVEGIGTGITTYDAPWFDELEPLAEADVKVKLPDGTVIESKLPNPKDGDPLMGRHYFEVPADLTSFTLMVGPASTRALRVTDDLSIPTTARLEGATWEVTLPAGNPPVQSEEPATAVTSPTTAAPRPEPDEDDSGVNAVLAALVLGVGAALVALVVIVRRRRRGGTPPDGISSEASDIPPTVGEHLSTVDLLELADGGTVRVAGPGAEEAVRASIVQRHRSADILLLARGETADLLPHTNAPGITVAADEDELLAAVEVAHLQRARDHSESNGSPIDDSRHDRAILVVAPAAVRDDVRRQLDAAIERACAEDGLAGYEATAVYVGGDPDSAAIRVEDDGIAFTEATAGPRRVATMADAEASELLRRTDRETTAIVAAPASATPQRVSLHVLGTYRIVVGDRELAAGLRTKARELLAYLAVNRDGATADAAVEALWPGTEPEKGQAYFRTVVANIRNVLRAESGAPDDAGFIDRIGQRYKLDEALVDADVWHLEDALAPTASANGSASAAGDLYRGDLLAREDFAWAEPARERLRRKVIGYLVATADSMREAGDLEGALRAAERSVECDPHDEGLYVRVMALHEQLGRGDAVRRTYEVMEAALSEIGVTPSERSRSLLLKPTGQREKRAGDA